MAMLRKISGTYQATELDGELVMIHADTAKFFAIKDVALHVWNALDGEANIDRICAGVEQSFDVDGETCRSSVKAFADQLVEAGFAEYF
jgi:hypothetical protein